MVIKQVNQPNHLDAMRLALAILVIASHSFDLGLGSAKSEPLYRLTGGYLSFGAMSVDSFFVISGLLIAASAERSLNIKDFVRKRIARIYPAFIVCALLMLWLELPMAAGQLAGKTLAHKAFDFVEQTLRLREFHYQLAFVKNPLPGELNGSLWSIQYEFWCYLGVALLVSLGLFRRRGWVLMLLILSLAWSVHSLTVCTDARSPLITLFGLPSFWARLAPLYLAGVVFYLYRDLIPLSWIGAMVAFAILVASHASPIAMALTIPTAGTYLLFCLAYMPRSVVERFGRFGDFSYGTYLYAFAVQQLLVHRVGHGIPPMRLFVIATPLTLILAIASWFGVERHFLRRGSVKPATP